MIAQVRSPTLFTIPVAIVIGAGINKNSKVLWGGSDVNNRFYPDSACAWFTIDRTIRDLTLENQ